MDFMKVLDQTVREIKREVNLKVLKIPEIEQRVLDATDDEPWGPHGSALAEIAQATKKFTECQMVMNVLWTRLSETDRNWRYVYKALAVVEYLVANGSDRAVDDIIEHTFQIASLSSFEYVEPSGKDMGINVRKKAENIVALLNDKDKIQEVRNKAAANRDKYFGLSSSAFKSGSGSGSASFGSSSFQGSDRYGGFGGTRDGDTFKDSYRDKDQFGKNRFEQNTFAKSRRGVTSENQQKSKRGSTRYDSKGKDTLASGASKPATKSNNSDKSTSSDSQSSSTPNKYGDDFDDFNPRETSSSKSAAVSSNQVDLFEQSLIGDLMDAPASVPADMSTVNNNSSEVDLFAVAAFVTAAPYVEAGGSSETQAKIDLFASQPASSSAVPSSVDFFAAPDPIAQPENKSSKSDVMNTNTVDLFDAVPLNNFDGSDIFGAITSHSDSLSTEPTQNPDGSYNNLNANSSAEPKPLAKKDSFQVKSGIWADTLSRGLIDLNISAPKKAPLADIGVVGGLNDGSDEKEKGLPTSLSMGRAMGSGTGLGRSAFTSSTAMDGDDFFSNLNNQQNQSGGFQK